MRSDQDVDVAVCQFLQNFFDLFCRFCPTQIVDGTREVAQSLAEGFVVLQCQYGGRNQHGHLFAVGYGFERGTNGHFGLSEPDIAAHKSVHRACRLHVVFDVVGGFQLVGRVFVAERRLQLLLQITVGRVGKTLLRHALRVEFDKVARNVFDFAFGAFFQPFPSAGAQFVDAWFFALFAFVFRNAMQCVYADKNDIVILENQFDNFLRPTVDSGGLQAAETPDAVVDVHHIVAHFELVEFFQRHGHFARTCHIAA